MNLGWRRALLVGGCWLASCVYAVNPEPPDEDELKQLPLKEVTGDLPENGVRYWATPLTELPYRGCYVTVLNRGTASAPVWEMFENTWGEPGAEQRAMIMRRGPAIERLGEPIELFNGTIISDVPVPEAPGSLKPKPDGGLSPKRGFTRPYMTWDPDTGYILMACVCPDYLPGTVVLQPAIMTSRTGEVGTWTYHGMITGEPLTEQQKAGRPIWCDGGSLLRMDDGSWRMYLNGFGTTLALLEAKTLAGPWAFRRTPDGKILELLPAPVKAPGMGGCFPFILRVRADEWHLWLTDTWPPQSIWHWWSTDGLTWKLYGRQPEITRKLVNGHGIKCIRTYLDPDGRTIVGLLSVWSKTPEGTEKSWRLHLTRMPAGPPPDASR